MIVRSWSCKTIIEPPGQYPYNFVFLQTLSFYWRPIPELANLYSEGEVPLLVKQWAGHILAYKRWLQWIFICAKVALLVMRLQGEILGSQMRFSDAYLLDLFECLWSISQCLTTRVCIPWYLSHSVTEEQLFLPMDSVMGNSIGGVEIFTSHELGDLLNSVFLHFDLQLKDHNLPLYCAHIWGK